MSSQVEILSEAAVLCGNKPISSLAETNKAATSGKAIYETTYTSMLTRHRWRFSATKQALTRLSDTPLNEYQYAYQMPSEPKCLKPIGVFGKFDYEIYRDQLWTDYTTVELDYQYRVSEEFLPPYFVELMAYACAIKMAKPITGSTSLVADFKLALEGNPAKGIAGLLHTAMASDSQGRPPDALPTDTFIAAR